MGDRLRNFGFLLWEVSRQYVHRFEMRAGEISLNLSQAKALVRLERNEGVSQTRLAELADVDATTMVRIVDRMEADGLLERRADRRARSLFMTPKATPVLEGIWLLVDEINTEIFHGIVNAEREVFMKVLQNIHDNVSALQAEPTAATAPSIRGRHASCP
jgi:MarR family transcriptional regulator, transcriptional regulator for hemolysin